MPVLPSPKRAPGFSIDSLMSKEGSTSGSSAPATVTNSFSGMGHGIPPEALLGARIGGLPGGITPVSAAHMAAPHPAFLNGATTLYHDGLPSIPAEHQAMLPNMSPANLLGHPFPGGLSPFGPHPGLTAPGVHPNMLGGLAAAQQKDFPFYSWLISRHSGYLNHRFTGMYITIDQGMYNLW